MEVSVGGTEETLWGEEGLAGTRENPLSTLQHSTTFHLHCSCPCLCLTDVLYQYTM